jgi:SAM-dependent methyltransferase
MNACSAQVGPGSVEGVLYCRGGLDYVLLEPPGIHVSGWLLHPTIPLNRVTIAVGGSDLGQTDIEPRPDVAKLFAAIPHAGASGFRLEAELPTLLHRMSELTVTCRTVAGAVQYRSLLPEQVPTGSFPPPELMWRVSGNADPAVFYGVGRQVAADLVRAMKAALRGGRPTSILDWGCGSGRVTHHLVQHLPGTLIAGSDVDSTAISWCRTRFKGLRFESHSTLPPLPFSSSSFDVVLGSSVFTHLDAAHQAAWIREIHRVLKPDGRLIASTHGGFAAAFFPELTRDLDTAGIVDSIRDPTLNALCPETYYRSVFQTKPYTEKILNPFFYVETYTEAGLAGFQDLFTAVRLPH